MSKIKISLAVAAAALTLSGNVSALPVIAAGDNEIFFNNYENLYRSSSICSQTPGSCLTADAGDPAGLQRVNPFIANNVMQNDIFVGVLNVQNIVSIASGTDVYNSVLGDRFTGYFVQKVANIAFSDPTAAVITLAATADPFGILAAGEMFRFYSGVASFTSSGTVAQSIASALGGTLWASFGLGTEGYAYTRTDLTQIVGASATEAFLGLDIVTKGPGYSAGDLNKVNDINEGDHGTTLFQVCSAADIANPLVSCTDAVGTSEIEANRAFNVNSPWMFQSNDPFIVNRIPEPTSIALMGLALLGLGFARRQK